MLNDFFDFLREVWEKVASSRVRILGGIYLILAGILISRLYSLQIIHGQEYLDNYMQMTEKTVTLPAARGRIYDTNGNLLAYNILTYTVILQDNGEYKTAAEKNAMLLRLVRILNSCGEEVEGEFKVRLSEDGTYEYSTASENARKGFLRDIYGLKSTNQLDDDAGKYPSAITAEELVENRVKYYGLDKVTDENGEPVEYTPLEKLEIINIRYTMSLTAYRKYESTTIASDVSQAAHISVVENAASLLGVDVIQSYKRVYNDPVYFSSIIGYTGKMQEDQVAKLQAIDPTYTLNDTVGRSGIEANMEDILHGSKGSRTMYVDNVGHIKQINSETPSRAGNDVYLTLDRDLQIGIYNLLERQLAGVLVSKIVDEDDPNAGVVDASKIMIPVKDAYYQLISNNVLDMDHFSSDGASATEKEVYRSFVSYRQSCLDTIFSELTSAVPKPMNELPDDINAYMIYIYNELVEKDLIVPDLIDQNTDYYKGWKADTISMKEYFYAGISDNWLDSSMLDVSTRYADADDIFAALVEYIRNLTADDRDYDKLNYKYLIKRGIVTGRQLCLLLLDQKIVDMNYVDYDRLSSGGETTAYEYLIEKIQNIEITPAQLALDPCTAGCVVTDVNTGEVRALVSYPGYDNNKLANSMDIAYYNMLLDDQSLPLYNNATQAKKAPGSTFKPITAAAALEEKELDLYEEITCTGIYDEINPPIRCWTYPNAHGALDVVGGIQNSCNCFFCEAAHRLSTDTEGNYDVQLGLEKIRKYASLFGLDHKSGVEITETDPNISTENPEQSAMGQGSHSFANVQLSRYVSAIANKGNVFELSIIDKAADSDGNIIEDYTPDISSKIEFNQSTWDAMQSGMRAVISEGSAKKIFAGLPVEIAGKTGTAQESKVRGNHAFFISFAPFKSPQIAVTVNIPYGYASSNAAAVARNVYSLYFGYRTLDDIMAGGALQVYDVTIGD